MPRLLIDWRTHCCIDRLNSPEIIGLLTALQLFEEGSYQSAAEEGRQHLEFVSKSLAGLPVESRLILPRTSTGSPSLQLALNTQALGRSAFAISRELKQGNPGVFVNEGRLDQDILAINSLHLDQARTAALARRLQAVLSDGRR